MYGFTSAVIPATIEKVSDMCGGYVLVVKYMFNSPPFSSTSLPVLSAVSRTAANEEIVMSVHEGCDQVDGGRPVRTSRD